MLPPAVVLRLMSWVAAPHTVMPDRSWPFSTPNSQVSLSYKYYGRSPSDRGTSMRVRV